MRSAIAIALVTQCLQTGSSLATRIDADPMDRVSRQESRSILFHDSSKGSPCAPLTPIDPLSVVGRWEMVQFSNPFDPPITYAPGSRPQLRLTLTHAEIWGRDPWGDIEIPLTVFPIEWHEYGVGAESPEDAVTPFGTCEPMYVRLHTSPSEDPCAPCKEPPCLYLSPGGCTDGGAFMYLNADGVHALRSNFGSVKALYR